ncbi:DMT family transporter [Kistimonas asteriae]|uniref:DMT family transporter n=1 Tax=Kistimonas asteriae TaxID=517724 RepID=UPI001BAA89D5|nr:DMT family transporter [Kistimonas asteriae]
MQRIAYIAFAALGIIWGSNFLFVKWASAFISPAQIVFLRIFFGFLPLLGYAVYRKEIRLSHLCYWPHFLMMSLLAAVLYYYAFALGISLLLSSVAGMLSGSIPLFAFVMTLIFLRDEAVSAQKGVGVALGFLGVFIIARPWVGGINGVNLEGVLYMALGSLSIGGSFVYARKFLSDLNISAVALSTYQVAFALLVSAAVTDFEGITRIAEDTKTLVGVAAGLGMLGTGGAFILYYFIVSQLGAVTASAATYIPPVVALVIGYFVVHEPVAPLDLVAMGLILCGVYFLQSEKQWFSWARLGKSHL